MLARLSGVLQQLLEAGRPATGSASQRGELSEEAQAGASVPTL